MRAFAQNLSWLTALVCAAAVHAATATNVVAAGPPAGKAVEDAADTEDAAAEEPAPSHPYQAIITRNSFGLKDPPPPPPPAQDTPPPVNTSALKLTCITTLLGKRAMFILEDPKTNRVSDLVREGERDRVITNLEVLTIDEKAGTVKVIFGGNEMTLDFVNNGRRPPTNMVAAVAPGSLPRPGMPTPAQFVQPLGNASGVSAPPSLPAGNTSFNAGSQSGLRNVPTRPSRLGGNLGGMSSPNVTTPVPSESPALSPDQQIAVMREQHRMAAQQNIELPPAPPAPGLEGLQGNSGPPALPGYNGPPALPGQP